MTVKTALLTFAIGLSFVGGLFLGGLMGYEDATREWAYHEQACDDLFEDVFAHQECRDALGIVP